MDNRLEPLAPGLPPPRRQEEDALRKHMVTASGRLRDTVSFSILDHEWPDVKKRLQKKLDEHAD